MPFVSSRVCALVGCAVLMLFSVARAEDVGVLAGMVAPAGKTGSLRPQISWARAAVGDSVLGAGTGAGTSTATGPGSSQPEGSAEASVGPEAGVQHAGRGALVVPAPGQPGYVDPRSPAEIRALMSNPFQDFLETAAGKSLPLFGFDAFKDVPSTFAPLDIPAVTADYVVGPGDELVLRGSGAIEMDYRAVVDREGQINVPRVGLVSVAGVRVGELTAVVKKALSRSFQNFDLSVSLGRLRALQVYVVGQARRPGSYTLSAMSTLVNAIFAAGGPAGRGSMRHVQLRRGERVVVDFDLYALLVHGDKSRDVHLLPGDVIFFPNVGPQVAVSGAVNVSAIFELRGASESLREVMAYAGGLSTIAGSQAATIERLEARRWRRLDDFTLDDKGLAREVRDGDLLSIRPISTRFDNAVSLKGFVAAPGRYPYRPGMRVRDLLPGVEALVSSDYWNRRNAAGVTQFSSPEAIIREITRGEEINWDYAVIERVSDDGAVRLIPFNLGRALREGDGQHNLPLEPGDIVSVFSKSDIRVAQEKRKRYITLEGEFAVPGIYEVAPGETLRSLVSRVGGFGRGAYLYGASFTRESVRVEQQRRLIEAAERMERDFKRSAMERAQSAVTKDQADTLQSEIASQQDFITRLKTARAQGRIVLEMPPDATQVRDLPELELEDGDRFVVPPPPSTVSVFGAVFNENSFVYRPGKRLGDYLAQAGGATKFADAGSLYLLRADGSVVSRRHSNWWGGGLEGERVMPGDAIVVPETLERFYFARELKTWTEIFYQFALGVAGIRVLQNGVK